jgi:hypothetical protein
MVESVTTYELRCIIGRAPFRLAKNNHISLLTSTCRCYGIRHTKWSLKVDNTQTRRLSAGLLCGDRHPTSATVHVHYASTPPIEAKRSASQG